jgi:hypothetical protein
VWRHLVAMQQHLFPAAIPAFLRSVITLILVSRTFFARFVTRRTHLMGSSNWLSCSRYAVVTAGLAEDRLDSVIPLTETFLLLAVLSYLQVTMDVFQVDNTCVVVRAQCFASRYSAPVHPHVSSYILVLHRAWDKYKRIQLLPAENFIMIHIVDFSLLVIIRPKACASAVLFFLTFREERTLDFGVCCYVQFQCNA